MKINLAYGKTGLEVELSDELDVTLVEPEFVPGLPDPEAALRAGLVAPIEAPPLCDVVRADDKVGVVFSDITRPTPNHLILPAVLNELAHVPRENITLFNALGTHRPNTDEELRGMLGDALVDGYRIVQNDTFDPSTQVRMGTTSRGHDVWLNRELVETDVKILTGFIEPHFFAGFSGGGKAVMPGMAGQQTVLGNHDAGMVGHPQATWGITRGNPIWEEVREVALKVGRIFLVNVTLNRDKQITGVFAGDQEWEDVFSDISQGIDEYNEPPDTWKESFQSHYENDQVPILVHSITAQVLNEMGFNEAQSNVLGKELAKWGMAMVNASKDMRGQSRGLV